MNIMERSRMLWMCVLALVLAAALIDCASLLSGSDQQVYISSEPAGAAVKIFDISGMQVWSSETPAAVTLDRGAGFFSGARYRVEITKKGYATEVLYIRSTLNGGWYLVGNFFIGGLIGYLIIDPLTGAMWNLTPKQLSTSLSKETAWKQPAQKESLTIVLKQDLDETFFTQLTPKRIN